MRRVNVVLIILLALSFTNTFTRIAGADEKKLRIAVVEFEIHGEDIGLKHISKIIPELLITELGKLKKYNIEERLLLAKVLEEQKLGLSGLIEASTAAKAGELFGVDAIVTGSAMKIAGEITINARTISTTSGQVIASGMVKLKNVAQLSAQIEVLANALCGISEDQLREKKEIEERQRVRYGLEYGILFNSDFDRPWSTISPLYFGFSFCSQWVDVNAYIAAGGSLGKEDIRLIYLSSSFNITPYLGIGAGWWQSEYKSDYLNFDVHSTQAGILIKLRPLNVLTARILVSGVCSGQIKENGTTYPISPGFSFPVNAGLMINVEYKLNENFDIKGIFSYSAEQPEGEPPPTRAQMTSMGVVLNYGFTLAGRK